MIDRQNIGMQTLGGKMLTGFGSVHASAMFSIGHQWLEQLCRSEPKGFGGRCRLRRMDEDGLLRTAIGGLTTDD